MALRDVLLPIVESIRAIPGELGLRQVQVFLRLRTWSGARVGMGTKTTVDTEITVSGHPPKVRLLKERDVIAGTTLEDDLYEIGPVTPEHSGAGTSVAELGPDQTATPTEMFYVLKGPGMGADGVLCSRVSAMLVRPFRYMVTVKRIGRAA